MNRHEWLLQTILHGRSDANIRFADLRALLQYLGFAERVRGSHHVYRKAGVVEKLNLQTAEQWRTGQTLSGETGSTVDPEIPTGRKRLMLKYEIIIYWSNEDRVFIAEVPELPGCMGHGDDQESALRNINDAMQLWIDTTREFGDPVPEPKGERLMFA